jgi:serine/threonine protein kinase
LLDILDGLAYAHQEGMIHRDIKPANILLTRGGQAVLADFGIAQIVGGTQHTVSGALLGTLNYMAPEQGLEGISDIRTDLYSLGVVYYEMLTRNPPFHADTPLAILLKHVNDPLPLPRDENPEIPLSLERIVLKALAKEPDGRYQTAVAMSEALRAAATETEITLPKRISLPLSFATSVAPAESVAVFSGKDRAKLANADFAVQDTSATRLEEWEPNLEALKENERSTPRVASGQISHQPERGSAGQVAKTFLNSMGLIVAVNLLIVMFSGQSGPAWFFMRGWPVELFLAAGIFLQLMRVKRNLWLFIPGGILFWEGILLTYYALTGDWENWSFLWPLQVLLIVGVIFYTINRAAQRHQAGQLAASLGRRYRRYVIIATGILLFVVLVG